MDPEKLRRLTRSDDPEALRQCARMLVRRQELDSARPIIHALICGGAAVLISDHQGFEGPPDALILRLSLNASALSLKAPVPLPLIWNERVARTLAADVAAKVLELHEHRRPDDPAPRDAVEAARRAGREGMPAAVLEHLCGSARASALRDLDGRSRQTRYKRSGLHAPKRARRADSYAAEAAAWCCASTPDFVARTVGCVGLIAPEHVTWAAQRMMTLLLGYEDDEGASSSVLSRDEVDEAP